LVEEHQRIVDEEVIGLVYLIVFGVQEMLAMKGVDVLYHHMFEHTTTIVSIFMALDFITYVNGHMVLRPIFCMHTPDLMNH